MRAMFTCTRASSASCTGDEATCSCGVEPWGCGTGCATACDLRGCASSVRVWSWQEGNGEPVLQGTPHGEPGRATGPEGNQRDCVAAAWWHPQAGRGAYTGGLRPTGKHEKHPAWPLAAASVHCTACCCTTAFSALPLQSFAAKVGSEVLRLCRARSWSP